jgi:hypothetical protein
MAKSLTAKALEGNRDPLGVVFAASHCREKNKNRTDPCGCEIAAIRKNEGWFAKDQGWQATKPSFWGANDWRSKTVLAIFMGVDERFCTSTAVPWVVKRRR